MADRAAAQGPKPKESGHSKPTSEPKRAPKATAPEAAWRLVADGDSRELAFDQPDASQATVGVRGPLSASQLLALQRTIGNRAVANRLRGAVQRVPVTANTSETLYNQTNATGQATARAYGGPKTYQITRQGDTGVTVTVRIKYLSQSRNTVDPASAGAPPGTPPLGRLLGRPAEIPAADPRRAWATGTSAQAVSHWNGRLAFVGEEWNVLSANTRKRLPVTFRAVPVFNSGDPADSQVIVHPPATVAGTAGQPIDAGNFYMNQGNYPQNMNVIYAHEYGHLIGIADEYSQNNQQMNALLHQASPGGAASAMRALDRETVKRMALVAMTRPLTQQLRAAMPTVANAMQAQGAQVKTRMAAAAREAIVSPVVRTQLETQLAAQADPTLGARVPGVVAFQTTRNFSNITRAAEGVEQAFSLAALRTQIGDTYARALSAPLGTDTAVAGLGDVRIHVQGSLRGALGAGPQSGNATALATSNVGPAAAPAGGGGGGAPGLPAVAPPASLVGQISALPATWATAGSALETGVTTAAFATKMQAILAAAAAAAAAPPPGALPVPAIGRQRELYLRAYEMVNGAATEAARQVAVDLVASAVDPVLQASVTALQAAIATEAQNVMTMNPTALAAAPNPDPNMRAIVSAMKTRLDQNKAATAGGGRNPGAGAAAQDVTYSYRGLMGSSATTALRADQFGPMLQQFNRDLRTAFERGNFTAEVR